MCDVVSEEAPLVAERWLLDLLVVLEIQQISDILADCSLIPLFNISIHVPGMYMG